MGNVDQGVFTYWLLAQRFRQPLSYIGVWRAGQAVRDLLHISWTWSICSTSSCSSRSDGMVQRSMFAVAESAASRCSRPPG